MYIKLYIAEIRKVRTVIWGEPVGRCPVSNSGCSLMIQQVFIPFNGKWGNYKMMQKIFLTP